MKTLFKFVALVSALLLAINFNVPKIDARTKKRIKKGARRFQHRAGNMLSRTITSLK
ncbi:hypothetical protein [Clostridium sp.]|uniref:hypothetical protein n=1 Tax=Clostridium sp. TaxID=1506 RepID=UPI003216CCC4